MRAETARVCEIAEEPADGQHARQCDKTDNADWNVALGDRQRFGFARFTRARRSHRAGQTADKRLSQLQQSPNCRNPDRAGANVSDFAAPCAAREHSHRCGEIMSKARIMWHSPAPADQRADQHRDSDRETDQVPNPEQQKRQGEIVTADRTFPSDPKILRDIGSEDLCLDD